MNEARIPYIHGRQLAQSAPSVTTAVQAFTPSSTARRVVITFISIVNRNASATQVDIYHDDDGTTYGAATNIYEHSVPANDSVEKEVYWPVSFGGNIAVKTATANDVTFTFYGTDYVESR